MLKNSSPLKHREGHSMLTEEAHKEAHGGVIPEEEPNTLFGIQNNSMGDTEEESELDKMISKWEKENNTFYQNPIQDISAEEDVNNPSSDNTFNFNTNQSDRIQQPMNIGMPIVVGEERDAYLQDERRGSHWMGKPDPNEYKRINGKWTHVDPVTKEQKPLDNSAGADSDTKSMIADLRFNATQKEFNIDEPLTWINKDEYTIAARIQQSDKYPGVSAVNNGAFVDIRLPNGEFISVNPDNEEKAEKAFNKLENFYKDNNKDKNFLSVMQFEDQNSFNSIWNEAGYKLELQTAGSAKDGTRTSTPILTKDGKKIDLGDAKGSGVDKVKNYLYNNATQEDVNNIKIAALRLEENQREATVQLKKDKIEGGEYIDAATNSFVRNDYSDLVLGYLNELGVSQETMNAFEDRFKTLSNGLSKSKDEMNMFNYVQQGFASAGGMTPDEFWGRGVNGNDEEILKQITDINSIINSLPNSVKIDGKNVPNPDIKKLRELFNAKIPNPSFNPAEKESESNLKQTSFMDQILKNGIHEKEKSIINDAVRTITDKQIRESNKDLLEVGAEIRQTESSNEKKIIDKKVEDFISSETSVIEKSFKDYENNIKHLAKQASKDGVSVKVDENGNFLFDGKNKKAIQYYKDKFGLLKKNTDGKIEDYNNTLKQYQNEYLNWQNSHGETLNIIDQTTRESDIFKISSTALSNGFRRIGYAALGLFDETQGMRKKMWMEEGEEVGLEKKIDYSAAIATGQKGRFAFREASTQGANTLVAMGATAVTGGYYGVTSLAARMTAPVLFGTYSGSDKYLELSIQQEAAEIAKQELKNLENNKALMSQEDYIKQKIALEKTIILGDIDQQTKDRVAWNSGMIEAGVMTIIGTVPNTQAITKRLGGNMLSKSNKIFRSNLQAYAYNLPKTIIGQTSGEIIEETSIEALNIVNDGLVLGRDMDFSTLDDVAITSIVSAGPTTGSFATYSTIVEQMQTAPYRKEVSGDIKRLKELEAKLGDDNMTKDMRDIITDEYKATIEKISNAHVGLEVDALAVGSGNIKKLIKASIEENYLNAIAGASPNSDKKTIERLRESYIKSLSPTEAKSYQDKLNSIQNLRKSITDKINYDGVAEKAFGDKGFAVQEKLKNKQAYKEASKRDKLVMVLEQIRKDKINNNIKIAKQDPGAVKQIEEMVYGMPFSETGRKNRKKKIEDAVYEDFANRLLVNQRQAKIQFAEGNTSAEGIINTLRKQGKKLEIVEQTDKAKMKEAVWNSNDLTEQDKIGISNAIESGQAKGIIIDNKYIVTNKKAAQENLDKYGDLLQGTVMSHEISHFIDDHSFKDTKEKDNYTNKLHNFISKNSKGVHDLALDRVNNLVDVDGTKLYDESKSFEEQNIKYKDEYTKSVQDLLMRDQFNKELNDIRKKSGKGLKNILGGTILGRSKIGKKLGIEEDFSIYTDENAAAWMVDFIDNFRQGKLSPIAKRKMKAAEQLGRSVATETKGVAQSADIVDQTKQNLQQIVDDASTVNEDTGDKTFDKSLFDPNSPALQAEIPGMVDAQVNNWFRKYPQLVKGFTPDAINTMKQELSADVVYRMLVSKSDRNYDGRGSLYGFLNGRIRYRMLDHFADSTVSVIPDFSKQELNEQRQELDKEFADDVTKVQNQELDQPRNKVNMLTNFTKLSPKQDDVKKAVEVKEGDTHADVNDSKNIKGNTGRVAEIIFNVPAKKILDRNEKGKPISANLTYAKTISKEGIPEPSEAGNIQSFYNNDNDVKNLVRSLPEFNITLNDSDINELGENIQVSPEVKGRSLGLKNRLIDFFYEPYIDPKATSEDADVRAESITNPKGRSRGKSSQTPVYRLKPEFRGKNISKETIQKVKDEAGITPRLELNKYDRTIGQFLKGLAFYQAQQATLSGAQRKLADQLQSIIDDPKTSVDAKKDAASKLKKQIANITVGQGKYSFSADAFISAKSALDDYANLRYGFRITDLPTIKGERKLANRLLGMYGAGTSYRIKSKKDIDQFIDKVVLPTFKMGPKEMFFGPDGGTVFTSSAKNLGLSASSSTEGPVWQEFVKRVKALAEDKNVKFGEPIPDVNPKDMWTLRNKYGTYFSSPKKIKENIDNGNIADFNRKVGAIHKEMWKRMAKLIKDDKQNAAGIATYLGFVANDTGHWHKLGAQFAGYSKEIKGKRYEYEHAMPATAAYVYLLDAALSDADNKTNSFNTAYELVVDNYKLISLDKAMDDKLRNAKTQAGLSLQKVMPDDWSVLTNNWFERYFNSIVAAQDGGINPDGLIGLDGRTFTDIYNVNASGNADIVNNNHKVNAMASMAANNARKINHETKSRGMSAFDFDETLIDKGENFIIATKGDDVVKISSGQWPLQGPKYAAEGYEFDFKDFVNVRGGVAGPLLQKLKNRIAKYGPENNYILTARPAESAEAIHEWLKTQGIKIPLKNITGLGNSTGEAKALWIADKYAQGYNDIYFVDDALPNVEAVADIIDQLDIKGKSVQARINFSADMNTRFNEILEEQSGVAAEKRFSEAKAKIRGKNKGRFRFFIPPSAEDFNGLLYSFLPKGKKGEAAMEFFKKALLDPYARGYRELNSAKQNIGDDYKALREAMPQTRKKLTKKIPNKKDFRYADAVRVYLWDKAGYDVPGLSENDRKFLTNLVKKDGDLLKFADTLGLISRRPEGYTKPQEHWLVTNILGDLQDAVDKVGRKEFLAEWIQNKDIIFSPENLNKIRAVYGDNFVEALKDMLWRMENGTNRNVGSGRLVNAWLNWTNNSVGAIMFFNARSAVLQTLSSVNFINWSDNNILKAGKAFANQPQFWKDFSTLFNSDMLKQRRRGLKTDVNHAELTEAVGRSKDPISAALNWFLQKGFLPTQMADSFAIASGGATFYRNRIDTYVKQGMTQEQAESKAFNDFQEIAEATQQSSRPDLISQQQASPLGRLILAFQNTPMQYMRLTKKAMSDLVNGRGDAKTHISKILYYGAIQNVIFLSLQQALFALAFDDEDDEKEKDKNAALKKERILNGMLDSILRGIGVTGAVVSTVKNIIMKLGEEQEKDGWRRGEDGPLVEALNISPPIGSKARKFVSAQKTWNYNEDVIREMPVFDINNPIWDAVGNVVSMSTNFPLDRLVHKTKNIKEALDEDNATWQRIALALGWSRWSLGIEDAEVETVKTEIKERKKEQRKIERQKKKEEKKKEKEIENKAKEEENKKKQEQEKKEGKKVLCAAINKSGNRCKSEALPGKSYCTVHEKVEKNKTGEKKQCSKIKSDGKRCKMKTNSKSGLCYYHD